MISATRNTLCMILVWLMAMAPALPAQQTGTPAAPAPTPINTPAPIPEQIRSAHRIFVSNGGGSNYFNIYTGGPDRAYNSFYAELQQENRYQLVGSPSQADLIIEIRAIAPADGEYRGAVDYNPQLILSIQDPQTHAVLWTTSANVRAVGLQASRDRKFDASVAVLVDRLDQVTGQTLTKTQQKAMNENTRTPRAVKVFIVVALAVGAGMTGYGIYRVTHPPSLPPLPQPATR
ncbi:MAG: hypothetical protein WA414_01165 [Acidobacteriaceae bacterium]